MAEYSLDIIGVQNSGDDSTLVETHCSCTFTQRDSKLYIRYTEDGISRLLTVSGQRVTLRTPGAPGSVLEFEQGLETHGEYHTPYGVIGLRILTRSLDIYDDTKFDDTDAGSTWRLNMDYELFADGSKLSDNTLQLTVTAVSA